jgi:nucleoside-triphosphatase THEP1
MKQREALDILKMGYNTFLTGPPGSGKTFLLNKYIEYLRKNKLSRMIPAKFQTSKEKGKKKR